MLQLIIQLLLYQNLQKTIILSLFCADKLFPLLLPLPLPRTERAELFDDIYNNYQYFFTDNTKMSENNVKVEIENTVSESNTDVAPDDVVMLSLMLLVLLQRCCALGAL